MGTSYSITLVDRVRPAELRKIKAAVEERLMGVNAEMSAWDPASELSRFNAFHSQESFPVSAGFAQVVKRALEISSATEGAFDPTVKPLVDFWGFGPENAPSVSFEEIMQSVGWRKVRLENGALIKTHPKVQLDLSAIAKGYGVDAVAAVIREQGCKNFLLEIGGEVRVSGFNPDKQPWRIGIETPDALTGGIHGVAVLSDRGMATSGDYRNFRFDEDGSRYSHIIDPSTGHPAASPVASVSVVADTCMEADAVATSLFVMGAEKGVPWVEERSGLEAFFILHADGKGFMVKSTSAFPGFM